MYVLYEKTVENDQKSENHRKKHAMSSEKRFAVQNGTVKKRKQEKLPQRVRMVDKAVCIGIKPCKFCLF